MSLLFLFNFGWLGAGPSAFTWVITTNPTTNTVRFTTNSPDVDLTQVFTGDYVNIFGLEFNINNRGSFTITNVQVSYPAGLLTQFFEIQNLLGVSETVFQIHAIDMVFFRPTRFSIQQAQGRTVVVSQNRFNTVDIVLPATSAIVSRTALTAAYLQPVITLAVTNLIRKSSGVATADTVSSTSGLVGTSDASLASIWSPLRVTDIVGNFSHTLTRLASGNVLLAGGANETGGVYGGESAVCQIFTITGTAAVADSNQADGSIRTSYNWLAATSMNATRQLHSAALLSDGRVLVTGGFRFTGSTFLNTAERYDPSLNSWTNTGNTMSVARAGHASVLLQNSTIMVIGGATGTSTVTATTDIYSVGPNTFAAGATMNQGRVDHQALVLSDGRVLVIGGRALTGGGTFSDAFHGFVTGDLIATCEIYNGTSWAFTGSMALARGLHQATLLPGDKVLVTGGLAYNPTQLGTRPGASTNFAEIWDPATGQWSQAGIAGTSRHGHTAVYLPGSNKVLIAGGTSTAGGAVLTQTEYFDVKTRTWRVAPDFIDVARYPCKSAILFGDNALLTGGDNGTTTFNNHLLFVHDSDSYSNGGVNGIAVVSAVLSATRFQFQTTTTEHSSSFGAPVNRFSNTGGALSPQKFNIASATRTSNVTTLTLDLPAGFLTHSILVGQSIYVNSFSGSFTPGVKTVTAVTSNTVVYADTGANVTALQVGSVSINFATSMLATPFRAQTSLVNIPGPYIWDPNSGAAVTAIESTTTGVINAGQQLQLLNLVSAAAFPDQVGYVIFGYATALQTLPVKYIGRASPTSLIIDFSFRFPQNLPVGTKVTFLNNLGGFVPTVANKVGSLYITASAAGRVAAQASIQAAVAAGVGVNITIVYPGDRGLGAEGFPATGKKISDKVFVWGSDSVDAELALDRSLS